MWKPDSKIFRGPDEDGEHYLFVEQKDNARREAKASHCQFRSGEDKEEAALRIKFDAVWDKIVSKMNEEAFMTMKEAFKTFESDSVGFTFKRLSSHRSTYPRFSCQINNDRVLSNNKLGCSIEVGLRNDAGCEIRMLSKTKMLLKIWINRVDPGQEQKLKHCPPDEWEEHIRAGLKPSRWERGGQEGDMYDWFLFELVKSFAKVETITEAAGERLEATAHFERR